MAAKADLRARSPLDQTFPRGKGHFYFAFTRESPSSAATVVQWKAGRADSGRATLPRGATAKPMDQESSGWAR